ncbi:MAG: DUF4435 domain-containing protein [Prevotella sp.]|nr:DUF4435 domain-containing protein [Prevotella sp.]
MGKRLRDNLTSTYFEAANKLNSKSSRHKIVAYVESYDDVFFWRQILSQFENDRVYFEVMLPTRVQRLERGKKAVLMQLLSNKVGQSMIACVDADYDYLEQGATPTSKEVTNNPYIFHTYAYAIENMQCYAPSLHDVCVAVTLNDHAIFDFEQFLSDFSEAIFPLFVWSIWYYRTPNYNKFTITDFLKTIETGNFTPNNSEEIIQNLRRKVGKKVEQLQRQNPDAHQSYQQVKQDLYDLGVTPTTTYLYIQGHHLFDKVVVPMLSKICEKLIRERENEIYRESVHGTQRRNELSCYTNSLEDIVPMLKKNSGFMRSEQFIDIKADLTGFMQSLDFSETMPQPKVSTAAMPQHSTPPAIQQH